MFPLFVIVRGWLAVPVVMTSPKLIAVVDRLKEAALPVPDSKTDWVFVPSDTAKDAAAAAGVFGLNTTDNVHVAPAATLEQVEVVVNKELPEGTTLKFRTLVPPFVTVITFVLGEPTATFPKAKVPELRLKTDVGAKGATMFAVSATSGFAFNVASVAM
jgi:hypothetical protein